MYYQKNFARIRKTVGFVVSLMQISKVFDFIQGRVVWVFKTKVKQQIIQLIFICRDKFHNYKDTIKLEIISGLYSPQREKTFVAKGLEFQSEMFFNISYLFHCFLLQKAKSHTVEMKIFWIYHMSCLYSVLWSLKYVSASDRDSLEI